MQPSVLPWVQVGVDGFSCFFGGFLGLGENTGVTETTRRFSIDQHDHVQTIHAARVTRVLSLGLRGLGKWIGKLGAGEERSMAFRLVS